MALYPTGYERAQRDYDNMQPPDGDDTCSAYDAAGHPLDEAVRCPLDRDEWTTDEAACPECGRTADDWLDPTRARVNPSAGRRAREKDLSGNLAQFVANYADQELPEAFLADLLKLGSKPGRAIPFILAIGEDDLPRLGLLLATLACEGLRARELERNLAALRTPHPAEAGE